MPADAVADDIVVEGYGTVTPPTTPPGGPVSFKKGDVLWQTRQAPDGWRFKVLEDRGGTVLAQPLAPATGKPAKGPDGTLEPVELNSANVELAKD